MEKMRVNVYIYKGVAYIPTVFDAPFGLVDFPPISKISVDNISELEAIVLGKMRAGAPRSIRADYKDDRLKAIPKEAGASGWRAFEKSATLFVLEEGVSGYQAMHVQRLNLDNNFSAPNAVKEVLDSKKPVEIAKAFVFWIMNRLAPQE